MKCCVAIALHYREDNIWRKIWTLMTQLKSYSEELNIDWDEILKTL